MSFVVFVQELDEQSATFGFAGCGQGSCYAGEVVEIVWTLLEMSQPVVFDRVELSGFDHLANIYGKSHCRWPIVIWPA